MNPKVILSVAALASVASVSDAIFLATTAGTAGAVTLTLGAGALGPALAVGGLAVLKAAAVGFALSRSNRRGRRSLEDDSTFAVIAEIEPEQCYQRLICDLATGQLPKSDNDVILNLFNEATPVSSPKATFARAARLGDHVKNVQVCELQYSCTLTGDQINQLL